MINGSKKGRPGQPSDRRKEKVVQKNQTIHLHQNERKSLKNHQSKAKQKQSLRKNKLKENLFNDRPMVDSEVVADLEDEAISEVVEAEVRTEAAEDGGHFVVAEDVAGQPKEAIQTGQMKQNINRLIEAAAEDSVVVEGIVVAAVTAEDSVA